MKITLILVMILFTLGRTMAQEWVLQGDQLVPKGDVKDPAQLLKRLAVKGSNDIFASAIKKTSDVILWAPGIATVAEYYQITLMDEGVSVRKKGQVIGDYNWVPLMFVEMKTEGTNFPPSYQNKWIYAVIVFNLNKTLPKNGVLKIVPQGRDEPSDQVCAEVVPIRWEEDLDKFKIGLGLFADTHDKVELREIQTALK